jgi:signal transduction histidine kinase
MALDRVWSSSAFGIAAALLLPTLTTLLVWSVGLPLYVFEPLVMLLVVAVALNWGLRSAIITAITAVVADDVFLHEPFGTPSITGVRDIVDLLCFLAVGLAVGWLVARSERDRRAAEAAAVRERGAREDRDRLIATITHDLANPLAAIHGTVQFAQRFGTTSEVDLARLLSRLDTAASRATSLLKTLADAKSLDAGELTLRLRSVNFRQLAAPVVQMFDKMSDRHPIVLQAPEMLPEVECDVERMQRVLENLIGNAIKYSPEGGCIEVIIDCDAEAVSIAIADDGIGIAPGSLPHIFERSFRAPEAAQAAPGLGLGLHTAAEIVRLHRGTLTAARREPRGTVMTLRLPHAGLDGQRRGTATADARAAVQMPSAQ